MSSNEPKKRLKAAESRRALLDAGLELLKSRGVAPGLDRVTLKEAIDVSGVPRSTAYRLYEGGKGQLEEFRADLLADLDNSVDPEPTRAAMEAVLASYESHLASNDPAQLAEVLRELIRTTMQTNMDSLVGSLEWRVYMSSLASLGTGSEVDQTMTDTFRAAADQFGERYTDWFKPLLGVFGLRMRDPFTADDFGTSVSAIAEGVALRQHVDTRLTSLKRPTGEHDALQAWSAASIAIESLLLVMSEPDPNAAVSADLNQWTAF